MPNLGALVTEVKRLVESRVPILDDAIVTHIQRAQRAIEDRGQFMVQEHSITFQHNLANQFTYDVPSDFIANRMTPIYTKKSADTQLIHMIESNDFTVIGKTSTFAPGPPKYWRDSVSEATGNLQWKIFPRSDDLGPSQVTSGAYDVNFPYTRRLTTLAVIGETNWWSENLDDVLAWKAAAMVFAELRDPLAEFWNGLSNGRFREILNQYKRNKVRTSDFQIYPKQSLSSRSKRRFGRQIVTRIP